MSNPFTPLNYGEPSSSRSENHGVKRKSFDPVGVGESQNHSIFMADTEEMGTTQIPIGSLALTKNLSKVILSENKEVPSKGEGIRYFMGTVDQVVRWHKLAKNTLFIIYEAVGRVESQRKSGNADLFFLRGESGHRIQSVYYNIDRELPPVQVADLVSVTGRMVGGNKIMVFDMKKFREEDMPALQRLSFLSQRSLYDTLNID